MGLLPNIIVCLVNCCQTKPSALLALHRGVSNRKGRKRHMYHSAALPCWASEGSKRMRAEVMEGGMRCWGGGGGGGGTGRLTVSTRHKHHKTNTAQCAASKCSVGEQGARMGGGWHARQ